jgi:hypothetical protein
MNGDPRHPGIRVQPPDAFQKLRRRHPVDRDDLVRDGEPGAQPLLHPGVDSARRVGGVVDRHDLERPPLPAVLRHIPSPSLRQPLCDRFAGKDGGGHAGSVRVRGGG